MKQYNVTGMSCAACSARVEKAVLAVEGVTSCSVSLLTNSMGVEGDVSDKAIIDAVKKAGYGASPKGGSTKKNISAEDALIDRETPALRNRLIVSLGFLAVLMYFSMGHMMWRFPVPKFFEENHVAMGLLQLLLTAAVMVINQRFFVSGYRALLKRAPNMDTLVALGSTAAFVYSTYALFAMTDAQAKGDMEGVMSYMHDFYFESAAMILALITVGKMLEAYSKGKTTNALKSLMRLAPKNANVIRDGIEISVSVDDVVVGDAFIVRPGESIPVDGIVTEGGSAVDESVLTGESIPVDKVEGDKVSSGTINRSGVLKCSATRVGEDTTLAQIIKMVSDAAATKAPIAKVADKVSGVFVPVVMVIALVTTIVWLLVGESVGFSLARGISVLVISCPCALGLATPVAIMVGNGVGAKNGILFKSAASIEIAGKVNAVILDKTGTITEGKPVVTDIIPAHGIGETELFSYAAAIEKNSEHPLAYAIVEKSKEMQLQSYNVEDFKALVGNGLEGYINGEKIIGCSLSYASRIVSIPSEMTILADELSAQGKTPLIFCRDDSLLGIICVSDRIKEDSAEAIGQLKNMGIRVVMLTGDNERTAKYIGELAGVDEVISGVLPDGKESVVRKMAEQGKVAMVGDGINDAPALTRADVGIAIGAGSDIAIDSADIVLMNSRLSDVPAAIRLSRATLTNIHENLFWAFFYNSIGIPLATGMFIALFDWQLNPMFGAAAMSISSFCVVSNALRLNLFNIRSTKRDRRIKNKNKQKRSRKNMTRIMKIEGMMCTHCSGRVKKVLESLPEVESAEVSHEAGTAVVNLSADIANEKLKETVEAQDYKVISIE